MIFKDIYDFRTKAPEIHQNYDWDRLATNANHIITTRIIPYISEAQYLVFEKGSFSLGEKYTDLYGNTVTSDGSVVLSANQQTVLNYLKPAIGYLTCAHILVSNRVQISEMGSQQSSSSDGTSNPASFHAIQDSKEEWINMAYEMLDLCLKYMDDHQSDFPEWTDSESFTEKHSVFVNSTKVLNNHVLAGLSRLTYLNLQPQLRQVQTHIKETLGQTFFDLLMTKLADWSNAETIYKNVIEMVQAWQAPAAMAEAIHLRRVVWKDGFMYIRTVNDGHRKDTAAHNDSIRALELQLQEMANKAKGYLLKYLEDNAATYPQYEVPDLKLRSDGKNSYGFPDNAYKRSFRV